MRDLNRRSAKKKQVSVFEARYSLHVSVPYNEAFLRGVKQLDGRWINQQWHVPAKHADALADLLDTTFPGWEGSTGDT